ncbi:DUF2147 domain-containing protein [Schlegelella sp. S2-27]|uniref:DUF2147 domain-containing protein n=1 Tax=Caldimonas mangrovi TaxID=2944811 RepID=A0ABT0YSY5_9BURK|nr:DUF2147 domain-containing protein [Caldimonas mangrovi]MCM5681424.1 DUF2147 domain-containing protein [Caldimonas mangrovi]
MPAFFHRLLHPALTLTVLLAAATCAVSAQPGAPDPRGSWLTASGNFEVEVAPCGAALCGTVVKVIANHSMSRPGEDMKPADPRPALGMRLLTGFEPTETAVVQDGGPPVPVEWRGEIYNRENGKTYRCLMSLGTSGHLVLRGYVGLPLFGRTQLWQRVAPPPAAQ